LSFESLLPILMFVSLLALLMAGFPVAFTLAGTALMFAVIGHFFDLFYLSDLGFIPSRIWGIINNVTLIAVPLFVFMGLLLEKTGIAEDLLETFRKILGGRRGSLAVAVIIVGTLLAASTGIVGATVVTMGVIALPIMLSQGYNKELACGTIAASGTLGQIIPPSIVLVLLGSIMNVDVGDLFVGAIFPGLTLVGLYLIYVLVWTRIKPDLAPMGDQELNIKWGEVTSALIPPLFLMVVVLGSILFGFASPTEAAACGGVGAILIAAFKRRVSLALLKNVCDRTARITGMVFLILIGAQFFEVAFHQSPVGLRLNLVVCEYLRVIWLSLKDRLRIL